MYLFVDIHSYIITAEPEVTVAELVNKMDKNRHTPLYHACESGSLEIAHLLIEHHATSPIPEFGYFYKIF
jgi:hypothetical protein